jgi:hypothetical protein
MSWYIAGSSLQPTPESGCFMIGDVFIEALLVGFLAGPMSGRLVTSLDVLIDPCGIVFCFLLGSVCCLKGWHGS